MVAQAFRMSDRDCVGTEKGPAGERVALLLPERVPQRIKLVEEVPNELVANGAVG